MTCAPRTLLFAVTLLGCTDTPNEGTVPTPRGTDDTGMTTDEPCQEQRWFADTDGDGSGDPYAMVIACQAPEGHVADDTDCDDTDPGLHPDRIWYADSDADGFGNPDAEHMGCHPPLRHVADNTDCDDTDPNRNPDASWFVDADGDGFGREDAPIPSCEDTTDAAVQAGDCDDEEPLVHPHRTEICDFIDNDCNGLTDDEDGSVDEFTQVLFYEDFDGDDHGSDVELGMFCLSSDPGARVSGDCDDTDASVHPDRLELPDETDQNCDGETTFHMLHAVPTGIATTALQPDYGLEAVAGDLDGDGLADIVVQSGAAADGAGQVFVFAGSLARDFVDAGSGTHQWSGVVEGDDLGGKPGILPGDMDGDGTEDLVLVAPGADAGAGAVYLLSGAASSGDVGTAATWSWTGPDSSAALGDLAALGDIDADGAADLLVSAPFYDGEGRDRGIVYILSSSSVGVSSNPGDGVAITGESTYHGFGQSPVNAGDMDGDGVDEILLGATGVSTLAQADGRVYRVPATELADADLSLPDADRYTGESRVSRLGASNHAVGDFNGDGHADILVTSEHQIPGYEAGTAYLLHGASTLPPDTNVGSADARIANDIPSVTLGGNGNWGEVSALGDLNGDGADDFALAAPGADLTRAYANNGLAALFLGGSLSGDHGTAGSADVLLHGLSQYGAWPVVAGGDVDSDGLDDIWFGHFATTSLDLYFLPGALFP